MWRFGRLRKGGVCAIARLLLKAQAEVCSRMTRNEIYSVRLAKHVRADQGKCDLQHMALVLELVVRGTSE